MLNPFLCLVFWLVLVFVNAPIGLVYACFAADIIAVHYFWTIHESQAKYFDILREIHVVYYFCIVVGEIVKINQQHCSEMVLLYTCSV